MDKGNKYSQSFLGKGWSFPPSFRKTGVDMVENEKDIRESLEILMSTRLGERTMLPEYGCDVHSFLFDSISTSKVHFLKELIRTAILKYEPRIELNDVYIDTKDYLDGIMRIQVDYTIETSNTRFNLVFPYYRIEGTNIPVLYHKQVQQNLKTVAND